MQLVPHQDPQSYILYIEPIDSNDGYHSYAKLFEACQHVIEILHERPKIVIDFNYCKFLDHLGVAFLGGIIHLIKKHQGHFTFAWDTLSPKIRMNLAQNGFLQEFSGNIEPWQGNSVPFRYDVDYTGDIFQYLEKQWLGRNWINISTQLQEEIVSNVLEIYANAFDHSQSPIGVFSCGQHYPQEKRLALTAIDFGVGIVSNVRSISRLNTLSTEEALRWAFQSGNSTRTGITGGTGLTLLHSFIAQNRGTLTICTNDGKVEISDGKIEYASTNRLFSGTLVNIDLQCDESEYCLSTESQPF
jgi:anti-anti-sigma regulatory factor